MAASTMERIHSLSAERTLLYRTSVGRLGNDVARGRIGEIGRELEALWAVRRRERAGSLDGIDLLVYRAYERLYGGDFDMSILPVGEEPEKPTGAVA